MTSVRSRSEIEPPDPDGPLSVLFELSRLLTRIEAMGLIEPTDGPITEPHRVRLALKSLQTAGIGRTVAGSLQARGVADDDDTLAALRLLNAHLEESPAPQTEWPALQAVLGAELLSELVGVSETSFRRYLRRERPTPDDVAGRLHSLALIAADLAGGYNDFGIRRWFIRQRSSLDGRAPREILKDAWSPDDPGPSAVRQLAAGLVGLGAT